MAPPAGQRSINAFFKAPAIATSVFRKPARADPPETEEVETESVPDRADVVAEEASRGGADWHLGGERRPVLRATVLVVGSVHPRLHRLLGAVAARVKRA